MTQYLIEANGIELCYEEFGDPANPTIILIMGLGTQMISWPLSLCQGLAESGFHVVRFDNRDNGLSQKMEDSRFSPIAIMVLKGLIRLPLKLSYTLEDMAEDVIGLMDSLGIEHAHLVGASMGGMIAQLATANHPDRVLSLTSIMSSSGNPKLPGASKAVTRAMARRSLGIDKPTIENTLKLRQLIGSPGYPTKESELRKRIEAATKRNYYPAGYSRQLAAIMANRSRIKQLKTISTPTLVIHGKNDPMVPVICGRDTAKHVSGSRLEIIDGMGHDLPDGLVPTFTRLISEHAIRVQEIAA